MTTEKRRHWDGVGLHRPNFQPDVDVSDEGIVAAFNSFIGQSGSYEVSGSTITTRAMIKKVPGNMGEPVEIQYRFEGVRTLFDPEPAGELD